MGSYLSVCLFADRTPCNICLRISPGMTRNHFNGKEVLYLEYESYDAMAKKKLHEICRTVRGRYGVERIVIVHRVGYVFSTIFWSSCYFSYILTIFHFAAS